MTSCWHSRIRLCVRIPAAGQAVVEKVWIWVTIIAAVVVISGSATSCSEKRLRYPARAWPVLLRTAAVAAQSGGRRGSPNRPHRNDYNRTLATRLSQALSPSTNKWEILGLPSSQTGPAARLLVEAVPFWR